MIVAKERSVGSKRQVTV